MGNYRVSISRRLLIDMEKNKSTNGVGVMIFLLLMARVQKCVQIELLLISKIKYKYCSFACVTSSIRLHHVLLLKIKNLSYEILSSDCSSFPLQIVPQLQSGKNVMIAAHGNSLRSIIMYLDKLTSQEVIYRF